MNDAYKAKDCALPKCKRIREPGRLKCTKHAGICPRCLHSEITTSLGYCERCRGEISNGLHIKHVRAGNEAAG